MKGKSILLKFAEARGMSTEEIEHTLIYTGLYLEYLKEGREHFEGITDRDESEKARKRLIDKSGEYLRHLWKQAAQVVGILTDLGADMSVYRPSRAAAQKAQEEHEELEAYRAMVPALEQKFEQLMTAHQKIRNLVNTLTAIRKDDPNHETVKELQVAVTTGYN